MLALSIRQPFAELILRGIKTAELRSRATAIVGRPFYLYAARTRAAMPVWSSDLAVGTPPAWMVELARQMRMIDAHADLPTGVLVGTAVIERVERVEPTANSDKRIENTESAKGADGAPGSAIRAARSAHVYAWHLVDVERLATPRRARRHPQPVWWRPF